MKGLFKKKHPLHLIWLVILFLKIAKELLLLLIPGQNQKRVFSEVPILSFKNTKSLKDHLVRAVLPQLDREGRYKPCEGPNRSCELCESVKDTTKFKKAQSEEIWHS